MVSDSVILKKIEEQPKHAAGFKQLVRELGVRGDEGKQLLRRLEKPVSSWQLLQVGGGRYAIPQASAGKNMVIGKLSMHRDGYGFVTPDPTAMDERLKTRITGDVFIPPPAVGAAMHGDRVLVEVSAVRPDGRAEGRILRTVNRAHPTVVGVFHYGRRENYVRPIDQKIAGEIVIPPGFENPETLLTTEGTESTEERPQRKPLSADRVLGNEAARHVDVENLENVVVDVEITSWPTGTQNPRGRVIEILGYEDDFGVDVEIIIRKHHLPHRFPHEVLHEAEAIEPIISSAELRKRRDSRALPIVTIDGETARDFDDAVLVRRLDKCSL